MRHFGGCTSKCLFLCAKIIYADPMSNQSPVQHFESNFESHLEDLKKLVRIPSISFEGFPASEVRRSAEAVRDLMVARGLEKVEILEVEGAHPYVYGEWMKAGPDAPTVLLYAHHDVQPTGRDELWKTKPFEPTLMDGPGGVRLYGRGTADDKAGVVVHTSAVHSFLKTEGKVPVNVKIVIEGEEEIGSTHLEKFLKLHHSKLSADVLILTDTANYDCGKPALTIALRGLVALDVEVRSLTKSVHSGLWGGPVPDPVMALSKMLATLVDAEGRIAIPEIRSMVKPLTSDEEVRMKKIPYDEADFRKQSGMLKGSHLLKEGPNPIAQLWRFPSLTVTAIQASSRKQAANIINDAAWARVTLRLVPDMDPVKVLAFLKAHLAKVTPWGLETTLTEDGHGAGPWSIDPTGPAFEAAVSSMKEGYGVEPLMMGCGGSIPFVKPFADALGGVPALLVGVEDPYTNAHGENESLLVSDFKKACVSQILLFQELSKRIQKKR